MSRVRSVSCHRGHTNHRALGLALEVLTMFREICQHVVQPVTGGALSIPWSKLISWAASTVEVPSTGLGNPPIARQGYSNKARGSSIKRVQAVDSAFTRFLGPWPGVGFSVDHLEMPAGSLGRWD